MKILINERLSEHRCKTPEGYLICTDAILARTGKQTYRKNEIFKDSDDETEIEVDRTEDEVFSPQTLASFENKPVTVEHPDEDVNVHNYKEYAVGFVRDVRRGEVDGQPVILGNLVITDEQTIQEIENGEHTDLSCGYDCDIADEPNPCQRNIRGNHVALCECGRAGIARIVDSKCKDEDELPEEEDSEFRYSGARGEEIYVTNYDGRNQFLVTGGPERYNEKMMSRRDVEMYLDRCGARFSRVIRDSKCKDFDDTGKNIRVVKEFIEQNGNKFDKRKDADAILEYIKKRTGIANADYGDVLYIIKEYTRAEITDSVKDTRMKVANLTNGYAIVPTSRWRKFGLNSDVERFTTNLDEARYIRSSLERNDGISFTIVDVTQRRTTDSMKDALIPPTKESINMFESLLRTSNIKIDRKGLTTFGRVHYQVHAFMPFNQFVKKLDLIDDEMNKLGIPMTFSAGADGDGDVCTAGIDLDKQHVKDSHGAQKIQKIVKVVKSIK